MAYIATTNCVLLCDPPTASVVDKQFLTCRAKASGGDVLIGIVITALSGKGNVGVISVTTPAGLQGTAQRVTADGVAVVLEGDSVVVQTQEVEPSSGAVVPSVVTVKVQSAGQTRATAI